MKESAAVALSFVIGIVVCWFLSGWYGLLIIFGSPTYFIVREWGRSTRFRTVAGAYIFDTVRNAIFVVPFIIAILQGKWIVAGLILVVFFINMFSDNRLSDDDSK